MPLLTLTLRRFAVPALLLPCLLAVPPARGQAPPAPAPLAAGDTVPAFEAEGLDGASWRVGFEKGADTVLLFFLSSCPTCHKMIPEWNRAYERRPKGLRVYGVMLDREPPGFFMAMPVSFPVLRAPVGEFRRAYRVPKVPLTLRVAPGGKVLDLGMGQLDGIRLGELFRP